MEEEDIQNSISENPKAEVSAPVEPLLAEVKVEESTELIPQSQESINLPQKSSPRHDLNEISEEEPKDFDVLDNEEIRTGNKKIKLSEASDNEEKIDVDTYEGEYNADLKKEGRGIFRFTNGDIYEGEFKNDKFEGKGLFRFVNGSTYQGDFKDDKREGRGIFRFANGDVYQGEFKDGKREGKGIYKFVNGSVYDGEYKADKREGKGVFKYSNGVVYQGDFINDRFEGIGTVK